MPTAFPPALHYFDCEYIAGRRNFYSEDTLCEVAEADVVRSRLVRKAKASGQDLDIGLDMRVQLVEKRDDAKAALYKGADGQGIERFIVAEPYPGGGWKVAALDWDEITARDALESYG